MKVSFKNIFYVQASLVLGASILFFGRDIFIPAFFSLLFSFILFPPVKWMKKKGLNDAFAISISMLAVFIIVSGIITLFSAQIVNIADEYSRFQLKVKSVLKQALEFFRSNLPFDYQFNASDILNSMGSIFSESGFSLISGTLGYTSTIFSYLVLILVFTFLTLLYRDHLVESMTRFAPQGEEDKFREMLSRVQKVGQQYLSGMILLIVVLGILNSVGLLLLGIEYALFFGFLAALLAVIPYVGTILGGLLPTLYAFFTYDSLWYPIGVILIFWFVQFLEGNFLNPKIVGGNLRINALFSIISLIAGGLLWGIAGMILFLPMMAILRVISSYYDNLHAVADLIGDRGDKPSEAKILKKLKSMFNK